MLKPPEVKDSEYWYGEGVFMEYIGKKEEALKCYNNAISANPLSPEAGGALRNKGRILGNLGRWNESIKCFIELTKVGTMLEESDEIMAMLENGRDDLLTKKHEKMIKENSNNFAAWYTMGHALHSLGRIEEALVCYDKALKRDFKNSYLWMDKASCLIDLEKYDKALICIEIAIKYDPQNPAIWNIKGISLAGLGKSEEALGCYDMAIKFNPFCANAWHNKGDLLSNLKKYEEAFYCYQKEVENDRGHEVDEVNEEYEAD